MHRPRRSTPLLRLCRAAFGIAAFVVPMVLYTATLRPDVDFWDTGEMQTVPWIWGIAHPTGFPAFVLIGYCFAHLFAFGTVAWRLSILSALCMATAAWTVFAAARELRVRPSIALAAAWLFAATNLAWSRGTRTEVHAMAIALSGLGLWLMLRFARRRALGLVPLGALIASLAVAVHPVTVFAVLGAATATLAVLRRDRAAVFANVSRAHLRRIAAATVLAALVGPLLYASMPLRSARLASIHADPTLGLGLPAGRPFWDYGHTATLDGFLRELSGSDFTVGGGLNGIFLPQTYSAVFERFVVPASNDLGYIVMIAALAGGVFLVRRNGALPAAAVLIGAVLAVPFAVSFTSESDVARYFLTAYWLICVLAALTFEQLASLLRTPLLRAARMRPFGRARRMALTVTTGEISANAALRADEPFVDGTHGGTSIAAQAPAALRERVRTTQRTRIRLPAYVDARAAATVIVTALLLGITARSLAANLPGMQVQHSDESARGFITRVARVTPPNAVIISVWTYATPLGYASYVEHVLGDRIVETAWPADDAAYLRDWMRTRPVVIVDAGGALPANVRTVRMLDDGFPRLLLVTALR